LKTQQSNKINVLPTIFSRTQNQSSFELFQSHVNSNIVQFWAFTCGPLWTLPWYRHPRPPDVCSMQRMDATKNPEKPTGNRNYFHGVNINRGN
jgi:hypothetical protein